MNFNFKKLIMVSGLLTLGACSKQNFLLPNSSNNFAQNVQYNNKVDLLILVDNSASMDPYQSTLAAQAPNIITALNNEGMDYRVGFITTDIQPNNAGTGGKLLGNPRFLTPVTPNLLSLMTAGINQGNLGSDVESGLDSLQEAVANDLNLPSGNFIRSDALLAIMVLTNENDYSTSTNDQTYETYLDSVKPNLPTGAKNWVMNFIGVTGLDSNCTSGHNYLEPGTRYMDLANYSGGQIESICQTDFTQSVSNIQKRVVQILTDFHLDRTPVVSSIAVSVNGVAVPNDATNGWQYIATGNFVRFYGTSIPGPTDKVNVTFTPNGAD